MCLLTRPSPERWKSACTLPGLQQTRRKDVCQGCNVQSGAWNLSSFHQVPAAHKSPQAWQCHGHQLCLTCFMSVEITVWLNTAPCLFKCAEILLPYRSFYPKTILALFPLHLFVGELHIGCFFLHKQKHHDLINNTKVNAKYIYLIKESFSCSFSGG